MTLTAGAPAAELALERVEWQRTLFAPRPARLDLLRLRAPWPVRPIRIRVHRNQPFEFVASAMAPFLAYAGFEARWAFGPYDDALAGVGEQRDAADVEIVWLDFARYEGRQAPDELAAWLASRLRALRRVSSAPMLVADATSSDAGGLNAALRAALGGIAGLHVVGQAAVVEALGTAYRDERGARFAGGTLSDAAAIETARRFGFGWLPAVLRPRLKAVAVDLDNTLYAGVLGEDGPGGLRLEAAHVALQRRLVELAESGVLVAVVSRNEPQDVAALFDARPDLPLRPEKLSATCVSWRPKSQSLAEVIERLRIGPDAVAFVDDNPGELAEVGSALPEVWPIHAADPERALAALRWHPGLLTLRTTAEDRLRAADLAAAGTRAGLAAEAAASGDPGAYLRALGIRLTFRLDPADQQSRIHDLSNKTNQFNTGFLRLSESDVAERLADPGAFVVTAALEDRLSDSGVVGLVVGRCDSGQVRVEDVAISCRALGRGIEDFLVAEALRGATAAAGPAAGAVRFRFRRGPRNAPAAEWLSRLAGTAVSDGEVAVPWPRLEAARSAIAGSIQSAWEGAP